MSTIQVNTSTLGNSLQTMLAAAEIKPGDAPSYETCKTIAAYHPLGAKMSDSPIAMAQSQQRNIVVQKGPEDRLKEAFEAEWAAIGADRHIFNTARLARIYGISSIALLTDGVPVDRPVDFNELYDAKIALNVYDPLNTAGSLVLNQDPMAPDFQKVQGIRVSGRSFHRSRSVTIMNEEPLYIEYTTSAFGFVGRSVYQRPFYPLKSFIQTMITDDLVSLKAGVLVAKLKQPGSIIDRGMAAIGGVKREIVKEAVVGNVISIGDTDDILSLNLQNLEGPFTQARKDILENIATAADMPAVILNQETFAEGFGEGTEDAKKVAQFVARIRVWMQPLYDFLDRIVMYRAWNREFYKTIQAEFPDEYGDVPYTKAFYDWRNSFKATWPNLLEEPDSEKVAVADVKLKAIIALVEVLGPMVDPENKAALIAWAQDNFNEITDLFGSPLGLDFDALRSYEPPVSPSPEAPPRPFSAQDSVQRAKDALTEAVGRLPNRKPAQRRLQDLHG